MGLTRKLIDESVMSLEHQLRTHGHECMGDVVCSKHEVEAAHRNAIQGFVSEVCAMEEALDKACWFRCNRCEQWTPPSKGCADDMPTVCDDCWAKIEEGC